MIPFFGPIIGAIPSAFLILLVNPWQAVFFAIFILILQQVEGNIICPRILGHSIGLKPFWVMVAIVVGSSLFGIAGMLIGVPTFAVIYTLMRSYLARKSREKEELEKAEN
jgi:predicted PurR-regulated permease PerM